ncbi:hypothetical protein GQ44DRAFT_768147 [Phaeosphaeriaceae sp. PMI808]|nr:hypothetical protein GQ44DRAFT_768147 [Phaeosphaeriaceae sp. PMI808]
MTDQTTEKHTGELGWSVEDEGRSTTDNPEIQMEPNASLWINPSAPKDCNLGTLNVIDSVINQEKNDIFQHTKHGNTAHLVDELSSVCRKAAVPDNIREVILNIAERYATMWEQENQEFRRQAKQSSQQLSDAEKRLQYLDSERKRTMSNMRELQVHAFQHFESPHWKPDCDDDIRYKLNLLDKSARTWAKQNSVADMQARQEQKSLNHQDLKDAVKPFAMTELIIDRLTKTGDKGWVLVQAFLMHRLYSDIFNVPFFGIDGEVLNSAHSCAEHGGTSGPTTRGSGESRANFMRHIYNDFMDCDFDEAVAWRANTLRQFQPQPRKGNQKDAAKMRKSTLNARERSADILSHEYLNSGILALLETPDYSSAKDSLKKLILQAAELSFSLWTQKIHLEVKTMADQLILGVFHHKNPWLETHRFHSIDLEDNLTQLDNMPIMVLTHPALVRYGDGYGEKSETPTVLKKAVCWIHDSSKSRQ